LRFGKLRQQAEAASDLSTWQFLSSLASRPLVEGETRSAARFSMLLVVFTAMPEDAPTEEPAQSPCLVTAETRQFLQSLESAKAKERRELFRSVLEQSTPEAVAEAIFSLYDQTGRESFLLHGVSLLEAFGERAWPALCSIARSKRPEVELFVGTIARCPGVPAPKRAEALLVLAENPSPAVRQRILERLGEFGPVEVQRLLNRLAADADPEVRADASDRRASLSGGAEG
jgi:hypothetical protein